MTTRSSVALGGLLVLALAGCGGAEQAAAPRETVTVTAPAPSPLSAAPTTATPSLEPAPTASESPSTAPGATTPLAGDAQKDLVTRLAATAVKNARPELLTAIKDDPRVEAVERFEFDRRDRTLRLQVASVFRASDEARDSLAYQLASGAAPLLWDPSIAGQVDKLSYLPNLDVRVDKRHFLCDGAAMAALANEELSETSFIARCAVDE